MGTGARPVDVQRGREGGRLPLKGSWGKACAWEAGHECIWRKNIPVGGRVSTEASTAGAEGVEW